MAETDQITLESIDPETSYVNSKKAHQARLGEQKKPRSFVAFLDSLPARKHPRRKLPIDQQAGNNCFLGKRQ